MIVTQTIIVSTTMMISSVNLDGTIWTQGRLLLKFSLDVKVEVSSLDVRETDNLGWN